MQQLAGIIKENYNKPSEKDVFDYWSIMVDNQPEDVKKILTNLITGKTSFSDFMTSTSDDVFDSFKDELYDDESLKENSDSEIDIEEIKDDMKSFYDIDVTDTQIKDWLKSYHYDRIEDDPDYDGNFFFDTEEREDFFYYLEDQY